jgi:transcriptional regulator with XRE-family HTH domain
MNDAGSNIALVRKRKRLSQGELAGFVGVSQTTISRIEKGEQEVGFPTLAKIARILNVELHELSPSAAAAEQPLSPDGSFYAFCQNPFCSSNEFGLNDDGGPYIRWRSRTQYDAVDWGDINFCAKCGEDLVKECPKCKLRLRQSGQFCTRCGQQLATRPTGNEWDQIRKKLASANNTAAQSGDFEDDIPF